MDTLTKYGLSRKYAVAFMRVFGEQVIVRMSDVVACIDLLKTKKIGFSILFLKRFSKEQQSKFITQLLEYLHLPDCFFSLVALLIKHNQLQLFMDVLQAIQMIVYAQSNLQDVFVYSSHPLSLKDQKKIENFINCLIKKTVARVLFCGDNSLIAGICIISGTNVWEYSVRKQLTTINAILHREGIRYE